MIPIIIARSGGSRWSPPGAKRTWKRSLPENWQDVPDKKRLQYFDLVERDEDRALQYILRDVLHLPVRTFNALDPYEAAAMRLSLSWMLPQPDCTNPVIASFRHKKVSYFLPKPSFENGTAIEYPIADEYYEAFKDSQSPQDLLRLVATLCRELNPDHAAALAAGDPRVALSDRDQVEARARRLEGLPLNICSVVLRYWLGVKLLIRETYHELFDAPAPAETEEDMEEEATGPRFGWWSNYLQIAEAGVFGDYLAVLQKRFHLICMYLIEQHDKNERLKRAHDALRPGKSYHDD